MKSTCKHKPDLSNISMTKKEVEKTEDTGEIENSTGEAGLLWWPEKSKFHKDDSFMQKLFKIFYKAGIALVLVIFSPILLLFFIVSFFAAF